MDTVRSVHPDVDEIDVSLLAMLLRQGCHRPVDTHLTRHSSEMALCALIGRTV